MSIGEVDFTAILSGPSTLGVIIWFNADEHKRYRRSDIREALENNGFSVEDYLPPPISHADIFSATCSSVEKKRQKEGGENGVYVDILVSSTKNDAKVSVRHITRRERDAKNVELRHPELARVIYHKKTGEISFEGENSGNMTSICETIRQRFEDWKDTYSVGVVRAMFRNLVRVECNGVKHRKNGGYFIPQERLDVCERLENLMRELGCDPDILEVATKAKSRASLREKVAAALLEEAQELIDSLKEAKTVAETMTLSARVNGLRASANLHGEALCTEFGDVLSKIFELNQLIEEKLSKDIPEDAA